MIDNFVSQSAVKGEQPKKTTGKREKTSRRERDKNKHSYNDIYGRNTPTLKNKLVC